MSNIYINEPPTDGKLVLVTNLGDIEIELWSREAPKACRNFVQLCMENYYNNTIFHRIIQGFVVQGGDPTGTGHGGESVYGAPFKDEFHQRLRFHRRGLVAMANSEPNSNGSQFFFSLDRADELNNKHTIFGKVSGSTIYTVTRLGELSTDEADRPICPPKIIKTEVIHNPFPDIVPRAVLKKTSSEGNRSSLKSSKIDSRGTKNITLLSFGDEIEQEDEDGALLKRIKIRSTHDVLDDPTLSKQPAADLSLHSSLDKSLSVAEVRNKLDKVNSLVVTMPTSSAKTAADQDEDDDSARKSDPKEEKLKELRAQTRRLKRELVQTKGGVTATTPSKGPDQGSFPGVQAQTQESLLEELGLERRVYLERKDSDAMFKKGDSREKLTLSLLAQLQHTISADGDIADPKENQHPIEDSDKGWQRHRLECQEEGLKAKLVSTIEADNYDVYDPRNPLNKRRRMEKPKQNR